MMQDVSFKWESADYRKAREALSKAEYELLDQIEKVAEMRRALGPSAPLETDYEFDEGPADLARNEPGDFFRTRLSELFGDKNQLIVIHYMFGAAAEDGCPMCSMWADGYNAVADHVRRHAGLALVARTGLAKLRRLAAEKGWDNLRLLSSAGNDFNPDLCVEGADGGQYPGVSVFVRDADGAVRHFYSTEMRRERGIDLMSPVWNLLDLTPGGRGEWYPSLRYG